MTVITWSRLMQAHIQMNQVEKAIQLLDEMEKYGIQPDSITFTNFLTACANNNLIEQGKKLHNILLRKKKLSNIEIINSIINMYVKCNQPEKAIKVFEKTTQKQTEPYFLELFDASLYSNESS